MDLWRYSNAAILRAAKTFRPNAVEVTLLTGLRVEVKMADGSWESIPGWRFNGLFTCQDFHR